MFGESEMSKKVLNSSEEVLLKRTQNSNLKSYNYC